MLVVWKWGPKNGPRIIYLSKQVVSDLSAVIGVDETESIETASFSVTGTVGGVLGQVVLHQREGVLHLAAVDHAQAGGGRELRPGSKKLIFQFEPDEHRRMNLLHVARAIIFFSGTGLC